MVFRRGDFLVMEKIAVEVLSWPMFPGLDLAQQVGELKKLHALGELLRDQFHLC